MILGPAVHAMKLTKRMGRIKMVSLTFDGPGAMTVSVNFKARLRKALSKQVRQNGRFRLTDRAGSIDWFITFEGTWPEADLDKVLNTIATELGGLMYMSPAIPVREMTTNPLNFLFVIDPRRERKTN